MRRWKMMFDRRGDVLRCEQLDGPPCRDGLELIVSEERELPRKGTGGNAGGSPPRPAGVPGGDTIDPEADIASQDAREQREAIVA